MQSARAWLVYGTVRVLAFAVPFVLVTLAVPDPSYDWLLGAAAGTAIGLLVSYIFLRRHRRRMGADLRGLRERRERRGELEIEEDEAVDEALEGEPAGSGSDEDAPDDGEPEDEER
ncbi:MAG: DUF4229 domain-containing protein [Pseudoclavibacter sp.]|nr:DUF4229 domain-containing protein [Pseudoclavibacter sp.]